jgi:hypothetical protein
MGHIRVMDDGTAFSVLHADGRVLEREICTADPHEALEYFEAAPAGQLEAVAWRHGPLCRWNRHPQVPKPLLCPEFRRIQGAAYRRLRDYYEAWVWPRSALAEDMRWYCGYYPSAIAGVRSIVEHEIVPGLARLVRDIDIAALVRELRQAQALDVVTLPRRRGDGADELPPGVFLLHAAGVKSPRGDWRAPDRSFLGQASAWPAGTARL